MSTDDPTGHLHHVLIVNYHSAGYLRVLVPSLMADPTVLCHVWDNASGEEEGELLGDLERHWPRLQVHQGENNIGFGAGMNRLVEAVAPAPLDCLWFLNPDTRVAPGTFQAMADGLHRGIGDLLSPQIVTGAGQEWFTQGSIDVRRGLTWQVGPTRDGRAEKADVSFLTGAALVMRAGTYTRLGGFREDLFLYWEDAALSLKAVGMGLRLAILSDVTIWHQVGGSGEPEGKSVAYYYYFSRNRLWVCGGSRRRWRVALVDGLWETIRLFKHAATERQRRGGKIWAALRGTARGLLTKPLTKSKEPGSSVDRPGPERGPNKDA